MSELSDLLAALPVPEHRPGFWEELETRLAQVDAESPDVIHFESWVGVETDESSATSRRRRGVRVAVLAAAAAAVVAVAAFIGFALLDDDTEEIPTITETTTPTTSAPTTPTTTATTVPDLETEAGFAVVEDAAMQFEFSPVELPAEIGTILVPDLHTNTFGGAVYVNTEGTGGAYRTTSGHDWEPVSGYNDLPGPKGSFVASDDRIATAGIAQLQECIAGPLEVQVIWSTDGETWTASPIRDDELDRLGDAVRYGCVTPMPVEIGIGPHGMLVILDVGVSFDPESTAASDLGVDEARRSFVEEFDLDPSVLDRTLARNISPWPDESGMRRYSEPSTGRTLGWWSPDGAEWSPVAQSGPIAGELGTPFGTNDGFILGGDGLWSTRDGSSWTRLRDDETDGPGSVDAWGVLNGEVVSLPSLHRLDRTPVLPADVAADIEFHAAGEFGAFGLQPAFGGPSDQPDIFFTDGSSWARWPMPETIGRSALVVGIGPDFVLLAQLHGPGEQKWQLWVGQIP